MSKELSIDDLKLLIQNAISSVQTYLSDLLKSQEKTEHKRASLLAYWIKDYINYIKAEKSFQPDKLIRYKRGSIVQVEFGFRIGNELGGRHYAVVIDRKNDLYSSTLTVVPLSSLKEKYQPNQYSFILNKGVFDLCTDKIQQSIDKIREQIKQLDEEETEKSLQFVAKEISLDEYKRFTKYKHKKEKDFSIQIALSQKHIHQLSNLRLGTVANVGQIITVSKQRIVAPINNRSNIYCVRLEKPDLVQLDEHINKLYLFKNNS